MRPRLRHEGDDVPIDLNDLDDRIRAGEIPGHAQLRHAPWTGNEFVPLSQLADLADAFDAPRARLGAWFAARRLPVASTVTTLVVLAFGLLQLFSVVLPLGDEGYVAVQSFYGSLATGLEALVFDQRVLSPWGSQLAHAGPMHLFPNLAVLGYCGFRVERALGSRGYGLVAAAALFFGVLFIVLFQRNAVIGSSVLGFGMWGAQLAIGFRYGDGIPPRQRRFYGYGNLLFFAVLVGASLYQETTSHVAHLGGFLGGVVATFGLRPPHVVPRAVSGRQGVVALAVIGGLSVATLLIGPVVSRVPVAAWWPAETIVLEDVGATLEVPARLLPEDGRTHVVSVQGMPAWTTSQASEEFVFCGLDTLRWERALAGDPLTGEDLASHWGRRLQGSAHPVEAPAPRGPGWTSHALEFVDAEGDARYLLVEQHLLRGRYLNRLGYVVALDGEDPGPRAELFDEVVSSIVVGEPPTLAAARDEHLRNDASPRIRVELAAALHDVGDFEQADALYALVIASEGDQTPRAVSERLDMWRLHPGAFPRTETPWFWRWLEDYPSDRSIQQDGVLYLAAVGDCAGARLFHEGLAANRPDAVELVSTAGAVLSCEQGR
ncbi:MAG: rhomboid family intramembrane serine protease [Proteobacteria bacterium]|nr:rhomboid family intramembrane serine protease [Pseudomonadota bacterium]MCP4920064.1 rhomboid family intramembrane serine protease [Pseudomonadota bacterium]